MSVTTAPSQHSLERRLPAIVPVTNAQGKRSREAYAAVLDQFDLAGPRYAPVPGTTYCNVFAHDATAAMGAPIPHLIIPATGAPCTLGTPGYQEQNCNRILPWLVKYGVKYGWLQVPQYTAISCACRGEPTVGVWENKNGPGHIVMVRPTPDGKLGCFVAQAGAVNFPVGPLSSAFGPDKIKDVRFFTHL